MKGKLRKENTYRKEWESTQKAKMPRLGYWRRNLRCNPGAWPEEVSGPTTPAYVKYTVTGGTETVTWWETGINFWLQNKIKTDVELNTYLFF